MAKISAPQSLTNCTDVPTLAQYLSPFIASVVSAVNGSLNFKDNFVANITTAQFSGTGIPVVIPHGLGQSPQGYIAIQLDVPAIIYNPQNAGPTFITLSSNTGTANATLLFF